MFKIFLIYIQEIKIFLINMLDYKFQDLFMVDILDKYLITIIIAILEWN